MISVNITYYNEPIWFKYWYLLFKKFYKDGVDIALNICDDGSQRDPASAFFEKNVPLPNMRLFRVKEDIGFNSHGARNLLMQQTQTEWNMMSDIDRHYSLNTLTKIIRAEQSDQLKQGTYYSMWEITPASKDRFSINECVLSKTDFWKTGGYDEEFTNIHWGDRYFFDTLNTIATREKVREWEVKYVRFARDVTYEDIPITQYPDDKTLIHPKGVWTEEKTRTALKEFVRNRNSTEQGRLAKKVINFDWEQVF